MKKIISIILCVLITISTIGCTSLNIFKDSYTNKLSHIELTEEEQNIIDLVGVKSNISIYEYVADDTYKSISIWLEIYKNGELLSNTKSRASMSIGVDPDNKLKKGKIIVIVDRTSDYKNYKWRILHQHANGSSSHSFTTENDFETNNNETDNTFSESIGVSAEPVEIAPEADIVLNTFLFNDADSMSTYRHQYDVENPEVVKEYDYVYLLKCKFSKKAVSEVHNQK
ncbi:MAG: hypothetical protein MJA31_19920 [Clostridia bacterium]|nr:hypothetical protein [Clostridia bacterium]